MTLAMAVGCIVAAFFAWYPLAAALALASIALMVERARGQLEDRIERIAQVLAKHVDEHVNRTRGLPEAVETLREEVQAIAADVVTVRKRTSHLKAENDTEHAHGANELSERVEAIHEEVQAISAEVALIAERLSDLADAADDDGANNDGGMESIYDD